VAAVNPDLGPPDHVAHLLNRAGRRLRTDTPRPAGLPDLNPAQTRILDVIPSGGCRIVDLSGELRVSKQGLGQLVGQLAAGGWVAVTDDPADRRAKIVRRTPAGDDVVRGVRDLLADTEGKWRAEVGPDRYAIFRAVLEELVSEHR
jgi:DNA-binding MarR family transcriptional regulator